MAAVPVRGRRGAHGPGGAGEPECKRPCRLQDTVPRQACAQLGGCATDGDARQRSLPDPAPCAARARHSSMISENHGSKGTSQPCPRCVAGESGHFSHILGC
ncbi:uncharacterized protein C10orf143 homolog [Prinia subflava]|uniref:uncharacterized protein C10orf143 homolog n=1 Tax=Prinia subflava TaxID=208062 RepID=UPI002FDFA032